MRKYQPVWQRLKTSTTLSCTVEVHRLIVARVVKAVIKEKDQDIAFKMANEGSPLKLAIKRIELADKKHIRLEFTLKQRYGLVDVQRVVTLENIEL